MRYDRILEPTEQPSTNAKKYPDIDHEAKTEADSNVKVDNRTEADCSIRRGIGSARSCSNVSYDRACERKEQEECCANEFAEHGNEI